MANQPSPTRAAIETAASRWRLLIVGGGDVQRCVLEPPAEVSVHADGRSARNDGSAPPNEGVVFSARGDGVLELIRGPDASVSLNDVQLARAAELRAGDVVQVGTCSVLVQHETALEPMRAAQSAWSRQLFEVRLEEEVRRARRARRPLELVFLRGRVPPDAEEAFTLSAQFSPAFAALLNPEGEGAPLDAAPPVGRAVLPNDALTTDELIECALSRLSGEAPLALPTEEPVVLDPMTVRLRAVTEHLAMGDHDALIEGEPGTGKRLWARQMHLRSGRRSGSWREIDGRRVSADEVAAALAGPPSGTGASGTLLVRHVDELGPAAREVLLSRWPAHLRVFATAALAGEGAEGLAREVIARVGRVTLSLPALRDRRSEVLPLAVQALQQARTQTRRPGLTLNPEVRAALQAWWWPGNVRELRNEIAIAAHVAESDEIRLENLSPRIAERFQSSRAASSRRDLRESLKAAEKNALLGVLARTGWNVTAAAKELGLPRRTVVYRIARLGLRRPGR